MYELRLENLIIYHAQNMESPSHTSIVIHNLILLVNLDEMGADVQ